MPDRPATSDQILTAVRIGTAHIGSDTMTDEQLRRAWAIGYARLVFPAAFQNQVIDIARWIIDGGDPS